MRATGVPLLTLLLGIEPRADLHATLRERAWSSPIW
jgi:hypothetical protein